MSVLGVGVDLVENARIQHSPVIAWLMIAYGAKLLIQTISASPFALLRKVLRLPALAKARLIANLPDSNGPSAIA